jgi:hypothetical protein
MGLHRYTSAAPEARREVSPGRPGFPARADFCACIQNQERHHRKMTFEEEFIALLKKHGIEYDPLYVFG